MCWIKEEIFEIFVYFRKYLKNNLSKNCLGQKSLAYDSYNGLEVNPLFNILQNVLESS